MGFRKINRHFLFRYLIVILVLLLILLFIIGTNDETVHPWLYFALGFYVSSFPVIVFGWPVFHFGYNNYKKKPEPLTLRRGLLYTLISLLMMPLLILTFLLPIAGLVICVVLLWQLGKWTAEIRDLKSKNEKIPSYKLRLTIFLGVNILLYIVTMNLFMSIIFAI